MYVIDIKIIEQNNETEAAHGSKNISRQAISWWSGHTLTANMQAWYWRRRKAARPWTKS